MDTFSSSVSTLKIQTLTPSNREFYHFTRTPYAAPTCPPQPQRHVSSTSIPNLVPKKTKTFSPKFSDSLPFTSPLKLKPSSSPIIHRKPATGYAAALIDVAQNTNSLHMVQRDVQRLLKLFQDLDFEADSVDPSVVMRWVVEHGNFHRHMVTLLKMLLKKNKLGIVQEVLEEIGRIYDELCGTQVVLVSSTTKMGADELFGIAKRVHQLSGAGTVKVTNLVQQGFPSFAV